MSLYEGSGGVTLLPSFILSLAHMTDELRWYLITKKKTEGLIASAFKRLREDGIEPVLIKGWAAARNYPDGKPRYLGDIDLAVAADDFERAKRLVEDPDSGIIGVDLHRELRQLDTVDWATLFENAELVDIDGEEVRVLAPEDHLRVMCVHWLTDGGESKEKLWDIYYAVQNRPASFDWAKCLEAVERNRRGWIIATIGLAHRYLGLEIDDLPFAAEARRLPAWLTRCVEREWKAEMPMRPMETVIGDAGSLLTEVRRRIPPNPIQATVNCEGVFDDRSRVVYQIRDFLRRARPSIKRVSEAMWIRMRR